jgi:hypothetical protein
MITSTEKKALMITGALLAAGCVIYARLNTKERNRFKRSLKTNTGLFLLNLIPYGIRMMRSPKPVDEVPGPTPYSTVEL